MSLMFIFNYMSDKPQCITSKREIPPHTKMQKSSLKWIVTNANSFHLPPTELRIDTSHLRQSRRERVRVCVGNIRWCAFVNLWVTKCIIFINAEYVDGATWNLFSVPGRLLGPNVVVSTMSLMVSTLPPVSDDILLLNEVLWTVMKNRRPLHSVIWICAWVPVSNARSAP